MSVSRRDFLEAGAAAAAGLALPALGDRASVAPILDRATHGTGAPGRLPIVISAANGYYRSNPSGTPIKKA